MTKTRRRDVLRASAYGLTVLAGCSARPSQRVRGATTLPTPRVSPTVSPISNAPKPSHSESVLAAIEGAGGLGFVQSGDTVLLKVNTNSGDPYPYSTSPEVVLLLARALKKMGAEVIVGDRSFWGDGDTRGNFEANGIAEAAALGKARLVAFEPMTGGSRGGVEWVELDPKLLPHWRPPIRVPRLFTEVHHVINLPCVKTHFITGVTLSMKNLLGLVHPRDRAREGNLRSHAQDRIYHQIAEVHGAVRPTFNVLDGYLALVSGGPTPMSGSGPKIFEAGRVFASHKRPEIDASGIALLKQHAALGEAVHDHEVNENPLLRAVSALGS